MAPADQQRRKSVGPKKGKKGKKGGRKKKIPKDLTGEAADNAKDSIKHRVFTTNHKHLE